MFNTDRECIEFMKGLLTKMQALLNHLGERPHELPYTEIEVARGHLQSLKDEMRDYYKRNQTQRAQAVMRPIEHDSCFPAVHQAWAELSIAANQKPSQKWISELEYARLTMDYALRPLVEREPST